MPSLVSSFILLATAAVQVSADLPLLTSADYAAYNAGNYGARPNQTFVSSDIVAPLFLVNSWNQNATGSASHIFMTPIMAKSSPGPMIFSSKDLSLVYANHSFIGASDARVQYNGDTPYLTFWAGHDYSGHGNGYGLIMDNTYQLKQNITTQRLSTGADSHEFQMTEDGGMLLNNFHTTMYNLTSVGGPVNGTLLDCSFEEIDIATGELRFEWTASDHFELTESQGDAWTAADQEGGWDWFHMNSLQKTADGNYLISSRHLRTLALINGTDGSKIWQLGGFKSSFEDLSDGNATSFAYQHNARFVDPSQMTDITFFDNQAMHANSPTPGCTQNCSRAMRVRLDTDAMTATLVSEFFHPQSVQAWAEGGYQILPNENVLTAWGIAGSFAEFTEDGECVMDIQNGPWSNRQTGLTQLYRVWSYDWTASPPWDPSIAVKNGTVYMSWNGATEVDSWVLTGGNSTSNMNVLTKVPRAGFETAIKPSAAVQFVQVQAVDADNNVLGTTTKLNMLTGAVVHDKRRDVFSKVVKASK